MKPNFILDSNDDLTLLIKSKGISTWVLLTKYITDLPYGRNSNRSNLALVIKELKGTCSSKHALLKQVANLNTISNIKLIIGIYKMNHINTPKIGNVLSENSIEYIPEAHCYLLIEDERMDFTTSNSNISRIKNDILIEKEIEPHQVADFKVNYHKAYMKTWLKEHEIPFSFKEIWNIREQCIANLST